MEEQGAAKKEGTFHEKVVFGVVFSHTVPFMLGTASIPEALAHSGGTDHGQQAAIQRGRRPYFCGGAGGLGTHYRDLGLA